MAIAVHPSLPVKSLKDLIALARSRPGELGYGTPGAGTTHHFVGEMLGVAANVKFNHVPYPGGGLQVTATAGGHVPIAIANVTEIAPFGKIAKVRALVVTADERAESLPDVPTFAEAGVKGMEVYGWQGLVAPKGLPPEVKKKLTDAAIKAMREPANVKKLEDLGITIVANQPEEFYAFVVRENERWKNLIANRKITVD